MRTFKFGVFFAFALPLVACSGGTPTSPSPQPGPAPVATTTLSIVDGLTGQLIASNGTASYKGGTVSVTNGTARFENLASGDRITITGIAGYRERNTLFCGNDQVLMWLNQGDVDEALTRGVGYTTNGGVMNRPDAIHLLPSAEIQADARAMSTLREGAARVMAAIEGKTPISVVTEPNSAGATFEVSIDPSIGSGGTTSSTVSGGKITGGKIRVVNNIQLWSMTLVMHEIGHALGIGHNPHSGLMSASGLLPDFTQAERKVLLLRYTRPLGAAYAGDNDQMVGCR